MLCHMKNIVPVASCVESPHLNRQILFQTIDDSVHPQENSAACFSNEPFWKPSITPYVVSFWVRQSLHHAYARRVFPYAKQIEETLTRSPYAALRKWGFCLRQTRWPNSLWQGPYWKCKGRFLERLKCIQTPWSASVKDPLIGNLHPLAPNSTVWSVSP